MKKIKKWDTVKIISGKNKKMTWIVEKMLEDMVLVQWINIVKRATKWKWYVEKTKPIHVSNVMYFDTETQQASKIKIVEDADWKRKRQISKTGRILKK